MHRFNRVAPLVGAVALAALGACGPFHRGSSLEPAIVIFQNESIDQATIYAYLPGSELVRIGTVLAGKTDTLQVPHTVTNRGAPVNLVARRFARNIVAQSGSFTIRPGDAYLVTLINEQPLLSVLGVEPEKPADTAKADTTDGT